MNQTAYKLIGFLVWRAFKWYVRERLPSTRTLALTGFAGASVLVAAAVLARRLAS